MTDRHRKHSTVVHKELEWHDACVIDEVAPGTGLAVSVGDEQIAIVRTQGGLLAAISNFDPFSTWEIAAACRKSPRPFTGKASPSRPVSAWRIEISGSRSSRSVSRTDEFR
jgi:hypothetical protein